ncbi:MAG: cysteine desulfurase family protein [Chlamydiales bacterium]|nr:cysteine desulfurase family protein [Chlamydiales bacterium]
MLKSIYLDNSATTRPSPDAIGKMLPYLSEYWGVPSQPHQMGQRLLPALDEAYKAMYALLGASDKDTIIFTSSGTEAVNHVVQSVYFDVTRTTGKNHFVTATIDEAPSILTMGRLEQLGCVGKMATVTTGGYVTAQAVADAISPRTALVSLSWANGLTGVINPVSEIAKLCKDRGILLHLDASHVLGKLYFELSEIGADFITFNGDTIHGPKGSGGLWIKEGVKLSPFILGGAQQAGHRAGDIDMPSMVGLGVACREAIDSRDLMCTEVARLRDQFERGVKKKFPDAVIFFREEQRLPNVSTIAFPGIANEAMAFALDRQQLYCSMGGGNFPQLGLILTSSGFNETLAHSALSFSLSRASFEEEIDQAIDIVASTAQRMRKLSEHIAIT